MKCYLCGKNEGEKLNEDPEIFACGDCILNLVLSELDKRERKPWYHTKINWGFWVLLMGFLAFLITRCVLKPLLGG